MIKYSLFISLFSFLLSSEPFGQYKTNKFYRPVKDRNLSITIDGLLNETEWENTSIITDFVQAEPSYGDPSTKSTEVRVLYDDESADEQGHVKVLMKMERFANNGNAMAQYNMGWIYARGLLKDEELMQDLKLAKMWFEKSASSGFKDAIDILQNNF